MERDRRTIGPFAGGAFRRGQAARTPAATAAVFEGARHVTYATLNAEANRLAHVLIARGIGPETVVGLALPRTPSMLVGVLGVLKAGATYLPIRSRVSSGTAGVDVRGHGAGMHRDHGGDRAADATRYRLALPRRAVDARRPARQPYAQSVGRRWSPAAPSGTSGLRDLHFGLDRPSEGHRAFASGARQSRRMASRERCGPVPPRCAAHAAVRVPDVQREHP